MYWYNGELGPTITHTSSDFGISNVGMSNCSTRNSYLWIFYEILRSEPIVSMVLVVLWLIRGIYSNVMVIKYSLKLSTILLYGISLSYFVWYSSFTFFITSWDSSYTYSSFILHSITILSHVIRASYSEILFVHGK